MARSSSKSTARKSPGSWGTTQQLPSGKWRAFYREEGERFTAPRTFATKADAQAWLAGERADRDRGTWRDPRQGQVHFGDYARAWLAARPDLAPRTLDLYQRQLDRWILPKLEPSTGKAVELTFLVDPSVLGGVVTTVGDTVIDGTIRHRLEQLKDAV